MPVNRTHYCQVFILSTTSLFSVFSFTPKCTYTHNTPNKGSDGHLTHPGLYTVSLSHPYRDRSDFERGMRREGVHWRDGKQNEERHGGGERQMAQCLEPENFPVPGLYPSASRSGDACMLSCTVLSDSLQHYGL